MTAFSWLKSLVGSGTASEQKAQQAVDLNDLEEVVYKRCEDFLERAVNTLLSCQHAFTAVPFQWLSGRNASEKFLSLYTQFTSNKRFADKLAHKNQVKKDYEEIIRRFGPVYAHLNDLINKGINKCEKKEINNTNALINSVLTEVPGLLHKRSVQESDDSKNSAAAK